MKTALPCLLALLLLCGCHAKEKMEVETPSNKTVTFVNAVHDANVWILPQTAANLKTTVWGPPTIAKAKMGESHPVPLCAPGDDGLYLFRMIDTDGFFHSANGLVLEDAWSLQLKGSDRQSITIEVSDGNGVLQNTYAVFAARL